MKDRLSTLWNRCNLFGANSSSRPDIASPTQQGNMSRKRKAKNNQPATSTPKSSPVVHLSTPKRRRKSGRKSGSNSGRKSGPNSGRKSGPNSGQKSGPNSGKKRRGFSQGILSPRVLKRKTPRKSLLSNSITIDLTLEEGEIIDLSGIEDKTNPETRDSLMTPEPRETRRTKKRNDDSVIICTPRVLKRTRSVTKEEEGGKESKRVKWADNGKDSADIQVVKEIPANKKPSKFKRVLKKIIVSPFRGRKKFKGKQSNNCQRSYNISSQGYNMSSRGYNMYSHKPHYNFSVDPNLEQGVFRFNASHHPPHRYPAMGMRQLSELSLAGGEMGNVYIPEDTTKSPMKMSGDLRPIVIDGSNVAYAHGDIVSKEKRSFDQKRFSCRGIKICVDYFRMRGHQEVKVVLPRKSMKNDDDVEDFDVLKKLEDDGHIVLTPSRSFTDGSGYMSYDDRFVIQYAISRDAVIISNDRFRDLQNEGPNFCRVISNRVLQFTFMNSNMLVFAKDPLGRRGPNLDTFLRF